MPSSHPSASPQVRTYLPSFCSAFCPVHLPSGILANLRIRGWCSLACVSVDWTVQPCTAVLFHSVARGQAALLCLLYGSCVRGPQASLPALCPLCRWPGLFWPHGLHCLSQFCSGRLLGGPQGPTCDTRWRHAQIWWPPRQVYSREQESPSTRSEWPWLSKAAACRAWKGGLWCWPSCWPSGVLLPVYISQLVWRWNETPESRSSEWNALNL